MKKALFLLLFIFPVMLSSVAQVIVDTSKVWSDLSGYCHPDYTVYTSEFFRFDEDTVMGAYTYKKVFISEDEFQSDWFFYGSFIREENKKVYYRKYSGEEGLIYDFNLEPGDTVVVNNPIAVSEVTLTLVEIDSVETPAGYVERWKLTSNEFETPEYWIYGVGSTAGVLNSTTNLFGGLCGTTILLCGFQGEELLYQNPDFEECYYEELIVGEEDTPVAEEQAFVVYNPRNQTAGITFSDRKKRQLTLLYQNGQIITTINSFSDKNSFSFTGRAKGLYVVMVQTEKNQTVVKKIMVY